MGDVRGWHRRVHDAGQKRVIAELYGKGKTMPELAAEYKVGVGTVWRALQPETIEAA